tara:strand:- start:136 stop:855 length:720 start_codon:yes stop_codon:yes gene_type:complete
MNFKFLLLLIVVCLIGCQNIDTPLYKAMDDIEKSWTKELLTEFANKPDSIALSDVHFGYGMYFRNQNIRSPKDSTIVNYFHSLNIYHEDYMSGIVFTSLHRKLNNKLIDLEGQLKMIHDAMEEVKNLESKNTARALSYYRKYQLKDTVVVRMSVNKYGNAIRNSYPDDSGWVYNDSLDLLITGVIVKKPKIQDTSSMYFNLKIVSLNHKKIKVLGPAVNIGDTIESDFRLDIIEDVKNK